MRLLRGKAKRARSVNAVYASTMPLAEKIAYCERLYESSALPVLFRITPFSQPQDLEAELEGRGVDVKDGQWGYRLMVVADPDGNELYFPYPASPATGPLGH